MIKLPKLKKRERERDKIQSKIINTTKIYRKVFNGSEQFYMHTKYVRNSLPLNTHKVPKINCLESSFERNSRYFTRGPCLPHNCNPIQ